MNTLRCPTCQLPHQPGATSAGTKLTCASCGEVFEVASPPTVPGPARPGESAAAGGEEPRELRILLALGAALLAAAFVVLGVAGVGAWLVANRVNQVAAERREAEVEQEQRRAEEEKRRAEEEARRRATQFPPPTFQTPPNPYKPGTQTTLRELRAVPLPPLPKRPQPGRLSGYYRMAHSPRHELLFVLEPRSVWVYDLKAGKPLGAQDPKGSFGDISLSPDQSALFVADFGGEPTGAYGVMVKPSYLHRFDLAARKWEARKAPKYAWAVEAVGPYHALLLEQDQWVDATLNRWEQDGATVSEQSRARAGYYGDIEYDPRIGRMYYGSREHSASEGSYFTVEGNTLKPSGRLWRHGSRPFSVTLSQDGGRLYSGAAQLHPNQPSTPIRTFPECIYAASRDIAFGFKAYYDAATGAELGDYDFNHSSAPSAVSVSPDGLSVWLVDRKKNAAVQYALEGEK